ISTIPRGNREREIRQTAAIEGPSNPGRRGTTGPGRGYFPLRDVEKRTRPPEGSRYRRRRGDTPSIIAGSGKGRPGSRIGTGLCSRPGGQTRKSKESRPGPPCDRDRPNTSQKGLSRRRKKRLKRSRDVKGLGSGETGRIPGRPGPRVKGKVERKRTGSPRGSISKTKGKSSWIASSQPPGRRSQS